MNELKPEDVMKALECHSLAGISTCDDCPYCDISEQGDCGCDMARDALALLREKDAEIERLKSDLQIWKDIANRETGYVAIERAETINEFAKELTSELIKGGIYPVFVKGAIERTAKKLKGETDG